MTNSEELFAKYYNKGKILVKDMDDTTLREHRESLRQIATEAKAVLVAADDEIRERGAKKSVANKEWLVSVDTDVIATDAINAVAARKTRMTKIDKMRKDLIAAHIDEDTVNEMIAQIERRATEQNLKTITFNKPSTEQAVVQVKKAVDTSSEVFDITKLNFGK